MKHLSKIKVFNSIIEAQMTQDILKQHKIYSEIRHSGIRFSGDMGDNFGAELYAFDKDAKMIFEILGDKEAE